MLDSSNEWFFDKDSKELYVWPQDNSDPNQLSFNARGYSEQKYLEGDEILNLKNSSHLVFDGIDLHTGTFDLYRTHDTTFINSKILYSGHHKYMLGAEVQNRTGDYSEHVHTITNDAGGNGGIGGFEANLSWVNCEFANSYSGFLDLGPNASNYLIENCYFHNKPRGGGAITNGRVLKGTTIKQSTFHTIGYGGLGKVGVKHAQKGGEAVVEFNRICAYHLHGDDS